jgi:hypothetical protein
MKQPDTDRAAERDRAVGEEHEEDRRWQREAGPCRKTAQIAGAHQADGKTDLAAGGAGQELAQGHEIGIGRFGEPFAPDDKLLAKISGIGPPKQVTPNLRKIRKTSSGKPAVRSLVPAECAATGIGYSLCRLFM